MKQVALITGASSGIGAATARKFAKQGYNIIITARRAERIKELKQELKQEYGVEVQAVNFDVSDRHSCEAVFDSLPEGFRDIDVLVNNAGRASDMAKIHDGDLSNWDEVINTNVKGLLYISRIVVAAMVKRGSGHVINIGSIAGTQPYEYGNVYCATKHAVHGLTHAMRIDLVGTGVRVTEVRPGKVETEFSLVRYHGDKEKADKVYSGYQALMPQDIADAVWWAVDKPAHVNVDEIVVTPSAIPNSYSPVPHSGK